MPGWLTLLWEVFFGPRPPVWVTISVTFNEAPMLTINAFEPPPGDPLVTETTVTFVPAKGANIVAVAGPNPDAADANLLAVVELPDDFVGNYFATYRNKYGKAKSSTPQPFDASAFIPVPPEPVPPTLKFVNDVPDAAPPAPIAPTA